MTRFVNSNAQSAADASHVTYAILVSMDFASGFVRIFNGAGGSLVFNGNTYQGIGGYGSIEVVSESTEIRPANPVTLRLSGVPESIFPFMAAAANNRADYFGRSLQIDIAFFDSKRQILTPIEGAVWEGNMDAMNVIRRDSSIALVCEDRMVIYNKTCNYYYTTEFHQLVFSGDTFFDQVPFLADRQINWGGGPAAAGNVSPGEGGRPRGPRPRPR